MNTCTLDHAPVAQPSHPLAQMWHGLAARWAAHLEALRERRDAELMSELNVDTLRDIGAPERWVDRAAYRRQADDMRLGDLRQWRGG